MRLEAGSAAPLGLSVEVAALGMLEVATASMAQAIRELSTERGDDVALFSLLAFGGAGGLFAPWLLRDLGLREVLVPRHPGVFAALGLHYADLRHHAQAPFPVALVGLDPGRLRSVLGELATSLDAALERDGGRAACETHDVQRRHAIRRTAPPAGGPAARARCARHRIGRKARRRLPRPPRAALRILSPRVRGGDHERARGGPRRAVEAAGSARRSRRASPIRYRARGVPRRSAPA